MKNNKNIIHANIENLTSLWLTASAPFQSFYEDTAFSYSQVRHSEWPNRMWFNKDIEGSDEAEQAAEMISSSSPKMTLAYWDIYGSESYNYLEEKNFTKIYELLGMSLKLGEPLNLQNRVHIKLVSNETDAELWEELFRKSFGYIISREILMNTTGEIDFYAAFHQNEPVGTAIIFTKNGVSGIHSVGIIPEMRRKGFADEIMKVLINKSIASGSEYATLQASAMGKGIYLRLGFEEQFVMKGYALE